MISEFAEPLPNGANFIAVDKTGSELIFRVKTDSGDVRFFVGLEDQGVAAVRMSDKRSVYLKWDIVSALIDRRNAYLSQLAGEQ